MGSTVQHSQRQLSKIHMAVAASVKRSWNSAACGCRSERAQRRQIQSKSYRGTTSCEWVETQKYVSKTLRTEFVRGATYSYSYSWMWGECEKWNENEHWAWISLTFGYGGVCCKAENRNKKIKINKKKIKEEKKIYGNCEWKTAVYEWIYMMSKI